MFHQLIRISFTLFVSMPVLAMSQERIQIIGSVPFAKDDTKIGIQQIVPAKLKGTLTKDSTIIKDKQFRFDIQASGPEYFWLRINELNTGMFLDTGVNQITVEDSLST